MCVLLRDLSVLTRQVTNKFLCTLIDHNEVPHTHNLTIIITYDDNTI